MPRKKDCRNVYKELRNAMSEEEVRTKSAFICRTIRCSHEYRQAEIILGYYPLGKEADIRQVLLQALKEGKTVALPKTENKEQMSFYVIKDLEQDIECGSFSIMEPKAYCESIEDFGNKQVLALVPGVVFDETGNRYGYGRGYYDRYFEQHPQIIRMAVAYHLQIADEGLEVLPTDIAMHKIVTEQELMIPVQIK